MNKIYVVTGHAGEHDDYRIWPSMGFYDVTDAEKYREKCMFEAERINKEINMLNEDFQNKEINVLYYWDKYDAIIKSNAVDESFDWEEPVDYTIDELEVR